MLTTIISFIIVFGILVFVHEFGHFIVAKKSGIMVKEFSIGMGPKLFYYRRNHTTYVIRILPLGGYVRMAGSMDDEDEDIQAGTNASLQLNENNVVSSIDLSNKNQLFQGIPFQITKTDLVNELWIEGYENGNEEELKRYSVDHDATIVQEDGIEVQIAPSDVQFQNAKLYKRFLTNVAGVFNNVLLAIVAFMILAFLQGGVSTNSNQVELTQGQSVARDAGIENNDKIISVNDNKTNDWNSLAKNIQNNPSKKTNLVIERNNQKIKVTLTPKSVKNQDKKVGVIGVTSKLDKSLSAKLLSGFSQTGDMAKRIGVALKNMVSKHFSLNDLGGPVAIFASTSEASKSGLNGIIYLLGFLSINLAIINLLPIPGLDGGKVLLNIIEMIRRKPVSEKVELIITAIGFVILITLMVLVTGNDLFRYFIK
ncbi:RIP metalloprotease RseP [Lactobacillus sp. S2-2]|uniref:RIP metalloprotease RseP n=1 Tax=Lactobacillus sp. S2-2 TaxID=2692917 RepID=UPI001F031FAE|nr:RIP metalloprotease RseP [Lactobacillus sp. S2-2]MCF6514945.1 RIP metalloprotease RseP [Lactobacillus sp. S2-2]